MTTTRLAAILFTDIVGYTAMMQTDQAQAMAAVKGYEAVLRERIAHHKGELIQTYGDGSLSIFDSASSAVLCAKEIQERIRETVPLRIGIHLGEVTRDGEHTFGDGVNIASRIESMGIAGAVLVSSSVRQQIKNKPEFDVKSLGKFSFKNVAEPMTVYALANEGFAVPDPQKMVGKGEKMVAPKTVSQSWIRFASIGFLAMAVGAMIFWGIASNQTDGQLTEQMRVERVAAIPFANRTGDESLDIFGSLCSELITNGLTEAGIKACSPRTIQQYNHLIGVLPNNPEGKTSFAEVTGARYWIEGYFLQQGDSLTFKSHLTDGQNGDIVRNFPEIMGHIQQKEALADQLTRRIMGYWVNKEVIDRGKFKPPKYEAYQEYMKAFQLTKGMWPNADKHRLHGSKAFEMDSTFYLAVLDEMFWDADRGSPQTDTLIRTLVPYYEQMTPFERLLFDANKALYESKTGQANSWPTYTRLREAQFELFPKDESNEHYAWHLFARVNDPLKAWEVMNVIDLDQVSDELGGWKENRSLFQGHYALGAGKYEEAIRLMNTHAKESHNPEIRGAYYLIISLAYLRSGQLDRVYAMIEELKQVKAATHWLKPEYDLVDFCNNAATELLLMEQEAEAHKFLHMALDWVAEDPGRMSSLYDSLDLAETWRLLGEPEKALPLEGYLADRYTKQKGWTEYTKVAYISGLGIDYALTGQTEKAEEVLQFLSLSIREESGSRSRGYHAARLSAVMNNKDAAVGYLQQVNFDGGKQPLFYKYDYFMRNLFGYPPFETYVEAGLERFEE